MCHVYISNMTYVTKEPLDISHIHYTTVYMQLGCRVKLEAKTETGHKWI